MTIIVLILSFIKFIDFYFYFVGKHDCQHVYLCTIRMQRPQRPDEGVKSNGTGVSSSCEQPYAVWGWSQGVLLST